MLLHKGLLHAVCGLVILSFPLSVFAQSGQQTASDDRVSSIGGADLIHPSMSTPAPEETASAELPDSPGAVHRQAENAQQQPASSSTSNVAPQQPSQSGSSIELAPQSQGAAAPAPVSADTKQQHPVGTAAAETPMVSGTTAAQPAGFAIAPAKQHRVRTLVIKVGAITGAAVALGTVMALTVATPSKPPGAH